MRYEIKLAVKSDSDAIEKLITEVNLPEQFDHDCTAFVARNSKPCIVGLVGIDFNREKYPQLEHIIVKPNYQKTKLSVLLLKYAEKYMVEKGYKVWVAYIPNTNNMMQTYAMKWGMTAYANDEDGVWFYKQLCKEK